MSFPHKSAIEFQMHAVVQEPMPLFLFTGNSTGNPVQPNLTLTLPVF